MAASGRMSLIVANHSDQPETSARLAEVNRRLLRCGELFHLDSGLQSRFITFVTFSSGP
jgi:hypothetical protein